MGASGSRELDGRIVTVPTTGARLALADAGRSSLLVRHLGRDDADAPTAARLLVVDERGARLCALEAGDALALDRGGQRSELQAAAESGTILVSVIEEHYP